MTSYKVGVTAAREGLTAAQIDTAVRLFQEVGINHDLDGRIELHQGCCVGGDEQLTIIAYTLGWRIVAHPPERMQYFSQLAYELANFQHVKKPYLYRNEDIVNVSDILLAFPKGIKEEIRSGTWTTVRYAKQRVRPTKVIAPNGDIL